MKDVHWNFPFLDLSFFHRNASHVWDHDTSNWKSFIFPVTDVFPLSRRPFESRMLPAPRNASAMILKSYQVNVCQTGEWSHRKEFGGIKTKTKTCEALYPIYPFVFRRPAAGGGCIESLQQDGNVLDEVLIQDDTC
jgi:hypothetical protein